MNVLLARGSQGDSTSAWIAAGAAVLAAVVTILAQLAMTRRQQTFETSSSARQQAHEMKLDQIARDFSMRQREIDWRVRQLNEVYGPLRMLRATSRLLRDSLPKTEADGQRWRLVRHIEESRQKAEYRVIVEGILRISRAIEDILVAKAGLLEGEEIPASFSKFMQHSRLLQIAWGAPTNVTEQPDLVGVADVPFPDEIDQDIETAIASVQKHLRRAREQTGTWNAQVLEEA